MTLKVITGFDDGFITRKSVLFFFVRICFKLFDKYIHICKLVEKYPKLSHIDNETRLSSFTSFPFSPARRNSNLIPSSFQRDPRRF